MKFRKEENQGHNLYFKAAVLEVVQSAEAIRLPPDEDSRHNTGFGRYCLNRHAYTINVCFMNTSVSRVRLKSLWGLEWHREYGMADPLPTWPEWMAGLRGS